MTERHVRIPTRPGLGRGLINHDERSKNYRVLPPAKELITKSWSRGAAYDQGETPECVAYTGKGILNTQTLSKKVPYNVRSQYSAEAFYKGAQQYDEEPGEDYEGTSGLGLLRFLKQAQFINEYRWCFGVQDVLMALSYLGPVGLGVMWTEDMFEPDKNYEIHPTGPEAGGHEFEVNRIDITRRRVMLTNSWGPEWGINGRAWLSFDSLDALLNNMGDAFVITS